VTRALSSTGINNRIGKFLKDNPNIRRALKVFEISHDQYESALQAGVSFYTSTSTQARSLAIKSEKIK
jgi:hypothetical protein